MSSCFLCMYLKWLLNNFVKITEDMQNSLNKQNASANILFFGLYHFVRLVHISAGLFTLNIQNNPMPFEMSVFSPCVTHNSASKVSEQNVCSQLYQIIFTRVSAIPCLELYFR